MEWKAQANAIIHDEHDPTVMVIIAECGACHEFGKRIVFHALNTDEKKENSLETYMTVCAHCGTKEVITIGTHQVQQFVPEEFMPVIGEQIQQARDTIQAARQVEEKVTTPPAQEEPIPTEPTVDVDVEVAWRKVMVQKGKVKLTRQEVTEVRDPVKSWGEIADMLGTDLPEEEDLHADSELSRFHVKVNDKNLLTMPQNEVDQLFTESGE